MRGISSILLAVQHLNIISLCFFNFQKDNPGTVGANLFKGYKNKIDFILSDMLSNSKIPKSVRDQIRIQYNSDPTSFIAIAENAALLSPDQRELVETMIEGLLKGETVEFLKNEQTRNMEGDRVGNEEIKTVDTQLA